jgi:hypothetical protein
LISIKKIRTLLFCKLICIVILIPFVARNIISSGYAAFPSTFPDVANVDWKLGKEKNTLMRKYILAYARTNSQAKIENIENSNSMKIREWLPIWWKNQSAADKSILIVMVFSALLLFIRTRKAFESDQRTKMALVTALAGITFWFIQAPDPRFGFGFIIILPAIVSGLYTPVSEKSFGDIRKKALLIITLITTVVTGIYIVYRVINFFSPSQLLLPMGIKQVNYKTVKCNKVNINIPETVYDCGNINVPCAYDSCKTFVPRGEKITDGFRTK